MGGSKGVAPSSQGVECCMCGDSGLCDALFSCKICQFRSQHRYCSDLYPKAESYGVCNWCLREEQGKGLRDATENHSISSTYNSSSSSSSNSSGSNISAVGLKLQRGSFPLHLNNPIKKQRSPEKLVHKRSVSGCTDELIKPTKSEDMTNVVRSSRQVFRGKVRRYKLLEEVSS
eukprot:TRINITY_DN2941_c2_g1_i1.p1 TRINITY_DN2941_c2_g1~~TRINITY_DN2941_c2_g1_i1.p1  ORF type:complete len:174 (+),score=8.94 TRINITY_DN2941_c2_g1_i1:126-647(+)